MKILTFLALIVLLSGCTNTPATPKDDVVKEPDKSGSVETIISITHDSAFDVLNTTHKVWVQGNLDKTIVTKDTLKSLGITTGEVNDSATGDAKQATIKKDYELYITVK